MFDTFESPSYLNKLSEERDIINNLSWENKQFLYRKYLTAQLGLIYNFDIKLTSEGIGIIKRWKDLKCISFEEFIKPIYIKDWGENWKSDISRRAAKYFLQGNSNFLHYYSIYQNELNK